MKAKERATVVGVFEDRQHADKAVVELHKAGYREDQIGVVMRHDEVAGAGSASDQDTDAGSGAVTGAVTGLGLGALVGLGVLTGFIPVVGPAIAAGTLGVILSNAAAGAGLAGLAGALVGAGIPKHEAEYYQGELEAGRAIVTVQAGTHADEVSAILRKHGAYDMSSRETAVGSSAGKTVSSTKGSTKVGSSVSDHAVSGHSSRTSAHGDDTIEVREERLHAEKAPVQVGEVRVRKEVHTETKTIEVPVDREEIVIERKAVHGKASTSSIREGEEIRIPVSEEKVHVTKDAVVTEEVKVGKRVVHDTKHVSGQVRKEEVRIEQEGDVDVKHKGTGKHSK